jgi:hypothetical protein
LIYDTLVIDKEATKMNKRISGAILLSVLLIFSGCGKSEHIITEEYYAAMTFEEAVADSTYALVATYRSAEQSTESIDFIFDVDTVLFGDYSADTVAVRQVYTRQNMEDEYEAGTSYILLLKEPEKSIFDGAYYHRTTDFSLPLDGPWTLQKQTVTPPSGTSITDYICELHSNSTSSSAARAR